MLASLLTLLISVFFIVHTSFGAVVVQKSSSSGGSQAVSESGIVQVSAGGAQIAEIGPNKDVPAAFAGCGKGGSVSVIKDEGQIDAKINGVQYTNGPVISIGEAKKCIYHVSQFNKISEIEFKNG